MPFTSFSENKALQDGRRPPVWFASSEDRLLAFFAGIHVRDWTSTRKVKEGEVTACLCGFLIKEPNAEVRAIHPKAMPVILTTVEKMEAWMAAPASEASALQQPLPDGTLRIVEREARGRVRRKGSVTSVVWRQA